jgi:hypothetical protein
MLVVLPRSVAPPTAGASSALMGVAAGSSRSDGTVLHATASVGLTTTSTRSRLGQRTSSSLREGSDSICVLGLGDGGGVPVSSVSTNTDNGTLMMTLPGRFMTRSVE